MKFSEAYEKVYPHKEEKQDPEEKPMVPETDSTKQGTEDENGEDE